MGVCDGVGGGGGGCLACAAMSQPWDGSRLRLVVLLCLGLGMVYVLAVLFTAGALAVCIARD